MRSRRQLAGSAGLPTGDSPGPHAGLVIGWERGGERWYAQVAYMIEGDAALVLQWLPADLLTPAAP